MNKLIIMMIFLGMAFSAKSQLYVDNTTGWVSQGIAVPEAALQIGTFGLTSTDYGFRMGGLGQFGVDANGVIGGRFTILQDGNTGIGTSAPITKLHVSGNTYISASNYIYGDQNYTLNTSKMIHEYSAQFPGWGMQYEIDGIWERMNFRSPSRAVLSVGLNEDKVGIRTTNLTHALSIAGDIGMTGTVYGVSDRRVKKDFQTIENALDKISLLNPVSYHFKRHENPELNLPENRHMGLIAQEVAEIFPNLVSTPDSEDDMLSLNYIELIPALVKSVQELNEKVIEKDTQIAKRDAQIEDILERLSVLEK